jgi:hypothetical protein
MRRASSRGARGDQGRIAELGQSLAQGGIDTEEYRLELVLPLRAGLDGRLLRQPQYAHVGGRAASSWARVPWAVLLDCGCAASGSWSSGT